jgi:hypothetical protein
MTISGMGSLIRKNTIMRSDRGGNGMNLINRVLMNLGYNDMKRQHVQEMGNIIEDYGYELYKSLEYNIRHVKNGNIELEKKLMNRVIE